MTAIEELYFPTKDGEKYATLTHAEVKHEDMGEKTITTQVKIDGEITPDFTRDWTVAFKGEKYIMPLRKPQGAKENTSLNATIDLTFQHWAIYQLKRWPFVTLAPIGAGTVIEDEEVASVNLNLKDFCTLYGQVLEYYYGDTIAIDFNEAGWSGGDPIGIEISHKLMWEVLTEVFFDKYGVHWSIEAAQGNDNAAEGGERYVIKVGYGAEEVNHIFEYGFEGGLLKVESQVQDSDIRNMIKGRGGEKNMPRYYFKQVPQAERERYFQDPDWVEELQNIYFTNLRGATFRSYVQGWKAAHKSQYAGYTPVGEANAYAPWAYRKGYTDTTFRPVEYVKDDESIAKYGPLQATLDDNDEIYPSIQGSGVDYAVAVEQIESDDVQASVESDVQPVNVSPVDTTTELAAGASKTVVMKSQPFTVDTGKTANLDEGTKTLEVRKEDKLVAEIARYISWYGGVDPFIVGTADYNVEVSNANLEVINTETGESRSASGIPAGTYYFKLTLQLHNTTPDKLKVTVACESPKATQATVGESKWRNTFDVWIPNVWGTTQNEGESDAAYAERVWKPVLGDREGNEAALMFTTGALAHEDYEFKFIKGVMPVPDNSMTKIVSVNPPLVITSHWRLTLAKSDAELEATGLYVPSTRKQGAAGDKILFIGTEMTQTYVDSAERLLDDWKTDHLGTVSEIKPTLVVTTDRVRLSNEGRPNALIDKLRIGNVVRIADKRFITTENESGQVVPSSAETRYLQSITYKYREPTSDDAALNPDVEIVLGDKYVSTASTVSIMQGEISALQRQVGSISNIEQVVRAIGDKLYLRKDGIGDRSYSPTQFVSLLTSDDFRAGIVGGRGWGMFKDENGNWVIETDRVNVRQEMQVNNLVINQVTARGGMEVSTAAYMECTRVDDTSGGYICYFDQKDGSVANLFKVGDVAYCQRWNAEYDADNPLKFYKRRVKAIGANTITLAKTPAEGGTTPASWPDNGVNGTGMPAEGDIIIHFGSYTDAERQYVKVRDVVGGGYERYIEGLNSVNAAGEEYYFVGRQSGMYNNRPRFYLGDPDGYIEWIDGKLNIKGELSVESTLGGVPIGEYVDAEAYNYARGTAIEANFVPTKNISNETRTLYKVLELKSGDKVHVSFDYDINGVVFDTSKGTPRIMMQFGGALGYTAAGWSVAANGSGHFEGAEITLGGTSTEPTATSLALRCDFCSGTGAEGTGVTIRNLMVQKEVGGRLFDWRPNPLDTDYLQRAMREDTTISGGLIQTTVVSVGYTDSAGTRHTMAGTSGLYDTTLAGGGIAFWAGGDMVDPQAATSGYATFGVRHDGTLWAANNTVRIGSSQMQVGDYLTLDSDGLEMAVNGSQKMLVGNYTVDGSYMLDTSQTFVFKENLADDDANDFHFSGLTSYARVNGSSLYFMLGTYSTSSYIGRRYANLGKLPVGSKVSFGNMKVTLTFGGAVDIGSASNFNSAPKLMLVLKRGSITQQRTITATADGSGGLQYDVSKITPFEIGGNGVHTLEIYFQNSIYISDTSQYSSGLASWNTARPQVITVEFPTENKTTLGNNGLCFSWGQSNQYQQSGLWGVRVNDSGIKITPQGIFVKAPDNGEWETLEAYVKRKAK